jgi:hypothetical protein
MRKSLLVVLLLGSLAVVGLGAPVGALAVGDANEAACPNEAMEGFREYLADCRAYEMVTPPFKNGDFASVEAVSGDGSHVLVESFQGYGGAAGNGEDGSSFELVRSGSGWVTSALDLPSSLSFNDPHLLAVGDGLGMTLWGMRSPSQSVNAEDLYVRETDGSFVSVGPMVPPSVADGPPVGSFPFVYTSLKRLVGVSGDLSHILFYIEGSSEDWPGDATQRVYSLYEYVGTGNTQPALVGVSDGSTMVNGQRLPAGHLISDCATNLGSVTDSASSDGDTYNAVSASGETVFFTAQGATAENACKGFEGPSVNELYARVGGVQTVPISEPTPSQCEKCSTAVEAPAEFQGASEDGSKVFFLTEQELLPEAKGMNLYEYDFDDPQGEKVVCVSLDPTEPSVEAGVLGVTRVSADGSHVYFVATGVLTGKNGEGAEPVLGGDNLYVFERDAAFPAGRLAFVGTLAGADAQDWGRADERPVQATPDGRFLVFDSAADLTPGDTSSQPQVFEYDAQTERLVRVSVGATGYPGGTASVDTNGASIPSQNYGQLAAPFTRPVDSRDLAVSADGSVVLFSSVGALTPGAVEAAAAGASSVYEYRSVGSIADGGVYLVSDGRDTTVLSGGGVGAFPVGMGASGGDVFFATHDPLVAQDVDTQEDIYDARVDGGFPAAVTPGVCEGEACQGALPGSPSFAGPGSVSGAGGGNLPSSPPGTAGGSPKAKPLTRAQRLAGALRVCRRERKKQKRLVCEAQAHKRFDRTSNAGGKGGR